MKTSDDVFSRPEVEELQRRFDDGTEWQTQNEFFNAWWLTNRLRRLLATARTALIERDGFQDGLIVANNAAERRGLERDKLCARVKELEEALFAAVQMLDIAEWPYEASEQMRLPGLSSLREVLSKGQESRSRLDLNEQWKLHMINRGFDPVKVPPREHTFEAYPPTAGNGTLAGACRVCGDYHDERSSFKPSADEDR